MEKAFTDADYFTDFFDNPKRFCEKITASFSSNLATIGLLSKSAGRHFMLTETMDLIRNRIYATGRLQRSIVNDIKLDALFPSLLVCKPKYEKDHNKEFEQVMLTMISEFKSD